MDAPKPGFFAVAAAEARRTWGCPAARLISVVLSICLVVIVGPHTYWGGGLARIETAPVWAANALLCWAAAWLGADFIPRGTEGGRLGARALGRLCPLIAAVRAVLFAVSAAWHSQREIRWIGPIPILEVPIALGFSWPLSSFGIFLASAFPFFILAALVGSSFRRPRRLLITPAVMMTSVTVMVLLLASSNEAAWEKDIIGTLGNGDPTQAFVALGAPNFLVLSLVGCLGDLIGTLIPLHLPVMEKLGQERGVFPIIAEVMLTNASLYGLLCLTRRNGVPGESPAGSRD
ncbi:MAG: hypothetical protein ACK47B_11320 [Armatimonadota bacterium]